MNNNRYMKLLFVSLFIICFQCTLFAQQLFNTGWQFHKGDTTNQQETAAWRDVTLPHDWSIEGPFDEQWASATAFLPGGIGWYKKEFTAGSNWQGKHIFIYFDGVYKNSTVWLNGHLLGNRPNGFIAFEYELTPYLNLTGKNILTVKVDHTEFADSRWYTGSGIYRNVYLKVKEPVYIAKWGVQFTTPSVTTTNAIANTRVTIKNTAAKHANITVQYSLTNNKGAVVAKASTPLSINANDMAATGISFNISNLALWSVDKPTLYQLSVTVTANGKTVDTYTEKVGIRQLRFDANDGFFLNNENIKLKGVCIHDDAGSLGVAVPEGVWRSRLQTLKELGCNSVRLSHNPHADYLYNLCDEMGFLVIDEAFDEWEVGKNKWIKGWNVGKPGNDGYHTYFKDWADIDVRDMILRGFNHPSIIAWSIGNEIDYPNDPYTDKVLDSGNNPQIYGKGFLADHPAASRLGETSKQLHDVVKQYDTTRPVTAALAGVVMSNKTTYPGNLDWVGYNYQEYRYNGDHQLYPNRVIYGSENGQALKAWDAVDSNQYISAQYLWTGIDYMGEAGKWPSKGSGAGLIDMAGFTKPEYYFRQSLWSDKPMVFIGAAKAPNEESKNIWAHLRAEPTWNWNTGDSLWVNCYTNCDEAELILNGKSLGKKKLTDFNNRIITWKVVYAQGKLEVTGYKKGRPSAHYTLQTTGAPASLKTTVDKDKQGLAQVAINILDANGLRVNKAENEIKVTVQGGVLLGLESGSTTSHEDNKGDTRKARNGRLKAYIMRNNAAKPASTTISSPGLPSVNISL